MVSSFDPAHGRAVRLPDERVKEILVDADIDGTLLRLPQYLDRADYKAVDKTLRALGGQWNRRRRAHVFDSDPSQAIALVLEGDDVPSPARTREGFVATPDALAEHVVATYSGLAPDASARILEPSAGDGALVNAVLAHAPSSRVVAVEPNPERARGIVQHPSITVHGDTFEHYATTTPALFDAIVMNPPFSNTDSRTVWIDHLRLAWDLLAPGGRLTTILPAGFTFRRDSRHTSARNLVTSHGGYHELAAGSFTASGSNINAVVAWLARPGTRLRHS